MPRACTICAHPDRQEIDSELLAGKSCRSIAGRYGLSKDAINRHLLNHVVGELEPVAAPASLASQLQNLMDETNRLKNYAVRAGDVRTALAAIDSIGRQIAIAVRALEVQASGRNQLREKMDTKSDAELLHTIRYLTSKSDLEFQNAVNIVLDRLGCPASLQN